MANRLAVVADTLLACVSDALSDDLRPVCKVYQTHGTPVIFQCCECDDGEIEGANGEVSIHFRRLFDADPSTLDEVRRIRPCKGGVIAAQFRLVLARCRPIINEHGEIPPPEELTDHTLDQLRDIELLWQSLACCTGLEVRIDDVSADLSDPGTCSVIYADVTVQVGVPPLPVPEPAGLFRLITEPGVVAVDQTDLRLTSVPNLGFEADVEGTIVFFGLAENLEAGIPGENLQYANLYLIISSSEPTVPEGAYFSSGRSYVQQDIDDMIAFLASAGVTATLAGQGVWFEENLSPVTITVA